MNAFSFPIGRGGQAARMALAGLALTLALGACRAQVPTTSAPSVSANPVAVGGEIAPLPKGPRPQPETSASPLALKLPQLSFGAKVPGTLVRPSFGPGSGGFPTGVVATSDISVVEKSTLNGKVFDGSHAPISGATVTVRSLNSAVPYQASTTTAGGSFAFNNAPAGVSIEIVVSLPGAAPRRRVEVLKSNKTGDPNANRFDFGTDGSATGFGSDAGGLSDLPEVVSVFPGRDAVGIDPHTDFELGFSEAMDRASVEAALLVRPDGAGESFDISAFETSWNAAGDTLHLHFKAGYALTAHQRYRLAFKPAAVIRDAGGDGRSGDYFHLDDQGFTAEAGFNVLSLLATPAEHPLSADEPEPESFPVPAPTPTPAPVATPAPLSDSDYFYFSYDDSASTAGVELSQAALRRGELPNPAWVRPWEFLNAAEFDPEGLSSTGLFKVGLGLWKHADVDYPGYATYEIGAQVSSPKLDRLQRRNLVLTVVLDVSGSMGQSANNEGATKLELARTALLRLQASLKPGDVLNLVTFSDDAEVTARQLQIGETDAGFAALVQALELRGGTNLDAGLKQAYATAREAFDPNKINRVVMLTDAYANEGETDAGRIAYYTSINHAEGIYFSGLGFGADFNEAFLNQLTEAGHGAYFAVISAQDVERTMGERFMALINVAARDVRFRLDFPRALQRFASAAEESSQVESHVQPTNFSYNTSQFFLEQFVGPGDDSLLEQPVRLTIDYLDPASGQRKAEIVETPLKQLLTSQTQNIRDAHLVTLLANLLTGTADVSRVRKELALLGAPTTELGRQYRQLIDTALRLKG